MNAIPTFSKYYGRAVRAVKFDGRWPAGFDLAEEFSAKTCPKLFDEEHPDKYIGPSMWEIAQPATFATKLVPQGRKWVPEIKEVFAAEWAHCVKPEVFINLHNPDKIYDAKEFNHLVRPFSHSNTTAELLKEVEASMATCLIYNPGLPPGLVETSKAGMAINSHTPSQIVANDVDPAPFIEFMEHLIVDRDDRYETERH